QTAGSPFSLSITAQDANNNTVTAFTGTVDITIDSGGISPTVSSAFVSGGRSESVTVTQSGSRTITVTRTGGSETGSSGAFTVNAGTVDHFLVANPGTQTAGTAFSLTITAKDVNNNTVTSFAGSVSIAVDSGTVTPTVSGSFVSGVRTESVTVSQAGSRTITVTGGGGSGSSGAFTVNAGALNHFLVEAAAGGNIGSQSAGVPFSIKITAQDANN